MYLCAMGAVDVMSEVYVEPVTLKKVGKTITLALSRALNNYRVYLAYGIQDGLTGCIYRVQVLV